MLLHAAAFAKPLLYMALLCCFHPDCRLDGWQASLLLQVPLLLCIALLLLLRLLSLFLITG
jgi:hypothetical protein